jgi:hypothetical protein
MEEYLTTLRLEIGEVRRDQLSFARDTTDYRQRREELNKLRDAAASLRRALKELVDPMPTNGQENVKTRTHNSGF